MGEQQQPREGPRSKSRPAHGHREAPALKQSRPPVYCRRLIERTRGAALPVAGAFAASSRCRRRVRKRRLHLRYPPRPWRRPRLPRAPMPPLKGVARALRRVQEYLKTAAIQKVGTSGRVTKPKRAFFEPGGIAGGAALQYLRLKGGTGRRTSPRSPPTSSTASPGRHGPADDREARRSISGRCSSGSGAAGCSTPRRKCPRRCLAKQVPPPLDNLIANIDGNAGNLLVDQSGT